MNFCYWQSRQILESSSIPTAEELQYSVYEEDSAGNGFHYLPVDISTEALYNEVVGTALHEVMHVLVFHDSHFHSFVNPLTGVQLLPVGTQEKHFTCDATLVGGSAVGVSSADWNVQYTVSGSNS